MRRNIDKTPFLYFDDFSELGGVWGDELFESDEKVE
jgi:hypothetical protein